MRTDTSVGNPRARRALLQPTRETVEEVTDEEELLVQGTDEEEALGEGAGHQGARDEAGDEAEDEAGDEEGDEAGDEEAVGDGAGSSGTSTVYLRGPARIPDAPAREQRPVIRPVGLA